MANSVIEQKPRFFLTPVGSEIIFVISNNDAVANQTKVKFVAEVHISKLSPNVNNTASLIGTFKTTPNNAGVGIFDFSNIIENYVSSDNLAANDSLYKGVTINEDNRVPIHLTDKYSKNFSPEKKKEFEKRVRELDGLMSEESAIDLVLKELFKEGYAEGGIADLLKV